jgi:hypothetical protein
MVNDSVPDYPINPKSLLMAGARIFGKEDWLAGAGDGMNKDSGRSGMASFPDAGYVVLRDNTQSFLFFDAGPMGPESMPGHGHADALSFILYGGGRPLIVDPGVYSYHDTTWRDYFRSMAVHNTVTIDNTDPCVFWGSFRVAYPPRARLLEWSENQVVGEHEGYRRLKSPVLHRRKIQRNTSGEWELVDYFTGSGEHDFALNLQFAPGAKAGMSSLNSEVRWPDGICLEVSCPSPPSGASATIEQGWVSPGWNQKEESPRYILRWRSKVPLETRLILRIKDRSA